MTNLVIERPKAVQFVVWLKTPGIWLGENQRWLPELQHARRFRTFREAEEASDGYDVLIKTIEE